MKRCPECRRDYYDETLLYCLDDGTALLEGPASGDERTEILSSELKTRQISQSSGSQAAAQMSSAEYLVSSVGRNKATVVIAAIVVIVLFAGTGYYLYRGRSVTEVTPRSIKIEKLTTDGKAFSVGMSPDGKHVVYSVDEGGAQSLWTKQVATSSGVQIVPPAEGAEYAGIQFTPDGNFVTFLKRDKSSSLYTLFQMSAFGGTQKKLATDVDGAISFSPNGKQFTFIRGNFPEMGESCLMVASADGSGERILAKRQRPETFPWWRSIGNVAWTPDGKTIAAIIGGPTTGSGLMDVVEVSVDDGSMKPITKTGWYDIRQVAWLPDKSGLLVMGAEKASDYFRQQIWYLSYPDGESRRITADFNNYIGMSYAADGKSLAAIQSNRISNIWIVPNADSSRAVQIKAGGTNQEGTDGLAWAADGRVVFYSTASGADDLWIMNGDGTGVKQLTADAGTNYDPVITPDGRYIVFISERSGQPNVWRTDLNGGDAKQLTHGKNETNVSVTPDSKWIFFDSTDVGFPGIWKIPIDGGEPVQVTKRYTENAEVSRDGKLFVSQFRENATASWRYALFTIDGGEPLKIFDLPNDSFRWSPDGRSLTYALTNKGVANIWSYPLDGGPPKQLTYFKNDQIFNFRWSPDGKSLVVARGTVMADMVLIRDFK